MALYKQANPLIELGKRIFPSKEAYLSVRAGPFRGGVFYANPRVSLRKVFGLYEAELNDWVAKAFKQADLVLDVGANDGYFTFGAAAAMQREGRPAKVVAFEPIPEHVEQLDIAKRRQKLSDAEVTIIPKLVGNADSDEMLRLDSLWDSHGKAARPLIKIDVEGAEIDVLDGAAKWIHPSTLFLIEVHERDYIEKIQKMLEGRAAPLELVLQKPLPILGREMRSVDNWWLVTKLD